MHGCQVRKVLVLGSLINSTVHALQISTVASACWSVCTTEFCSLAAGLLIPSNSVRAAAAPTSKLSGAPGHHLEMAGGR